jgi:hypothetical protein
MQLKMYNEVSEKAESKEGVQVVITNDAPSPEQAAAYRRFWEMVLVRVLNQKAA